MDINDKRTLLAGYLAQFRCWSYERLAAEIDRTHAEHECLGHVEGTYADGRPYHMEFNVFWDDQKDGDLRVCGDLTTLPARPLLGLIPVFTPDLTDSFLMRPDGSIVGG